MEAAIKTAVVVFGENEVFRKYLKNGYETRLNRAVFDVVAYAFADPAVRKVLAQPGKAAKMKQEFEKISINSKFRNSIETTTKSLTATSTRFSLFLLAVKRVTGCDVPFSLEQ